MARPTSRRDVPTLTAAASALLLIAAACSPPAAEGGLDPNAPKGQVVTAEAIAATHASSVWDALRLTVRNVSYSTDSSGRPGAIRSRGRSSIRTYDSLLVYIDNVLLSDISVLGQMSASTVERIVVMSGIEATTYFGTNAGDGVIHIITKSR